MPDRFYCFFVCHDFFSIMGLNAGHFAGPLPARIFPSVAVRQKHAAHYNEIRRKCPIVHPESNGSLPVIRPTPWKRSAGSVCRKVSELYAAKPSEPAGTACTAVRRRNSSRQEPPGSGRPFNRMTVLSDRQKLLHAIRFSYWTIVYLIDRICA